MSRPIKEHAPSFQKALFLFRRDLRLEDNTGLIFALKHASTVIPAFILTPEQTEKNPYLSKRCLQFMFECLEDLSGQLKKKKSTLYLFQGDPLSIVKKCIALLKIDALIFNKDYTPYSQKRDQALHKLCEKHQIACHSFDDALLLAPQDSTKKDQTPYTIFTPYFRHALDFPPPFPLPTPSSRFFQGKIAFAKPISLLAQRSPCLNNSIRGGRKEVLKLLKHLKSLATYSKDHDFPAKQATSHLSAYLKFTVLSPREIYHAIAKTFTLRHALIRSLYWRDFFTTIAYFFPHVFQGAFHSKFDKIRWSYDKDKFHTWCQGKTGFPIVDAAMRELNQTGMMHNRARMIAASFLVKDLHIDWRWGEKYFAQTLIDYDPAVNNGNWQWSASTGADAQPYFRIFNPWLQQKKFDPDCAYIKQWIPELKTISPKMIHGWSNPKNRKTQINYPAPLVDHAKQAKQTLATYKQVR